MNDDFVWDVVVNNRADALVTLNKRDFAATGKHFAVPVLTPQEVLEGLAKRGFHGAREEDKYYAARLVPTIREKAEEICQREGISLNQFLNLALMRQITFFEQQGKPRLSQRLSQREAKVVLKEFLDRQSSEDPMPADEMPNAH